ncbi:MAG: formylmethanofuran dehydrogenase subunit E family protein [Candidatus Omnitrophica bacterium]|nr:formylmethanofuran dehydrogenase subunit E family protein [Candidatus Omnitrophota bacterium]
MKNSRVSLEAAKEFHGHLGPYLTLGLLAGELALRELNCKKYFGLYIKVYGAQKKPKSCLIDGLQLSTGATYGKGNIEKFGGRSIKMDFYQKERKDYLSIRLNKAVIKKLKNAKTHMQCELLAKRLFKEDADNILTYHWCQRPNI